MVISIESMHAVWVEINFRLTLVYLLMFTDCSKWSLWFCEQLEVKIWLWRLRGLETPHFLGDAQVDNKNNNS